MDLVLILRELWRLRVFVLIAALLALLTGLALVYRLPSLESRKYDVGVATTRILVDTPNSQVVEVDPKGSETLGVRANLIANLMAEGVVKDAIAKRAGISSERLEGVAESAAGPAPAREPSPSQSFILTTRVSSTADGERLPIIEVEAQAPDPSRAAKLAAAAVTGLSDFLDSKAASEQVPQAQRLRVTGLGSAQAREVVRGPRQYIAVGVALVIFAAGCGAMLLISAVVRRWRFDSEFQPFRSDADDDHDPVAGLLADEQGLSQPAQRR